MKYVPFKCLDIERALNRVYFSVPRVPCAESLALFHLVLDRNWKIFSLNIKFRQSHRSCAELVVGRVLNSNGSGT